MVKISTAATAAVVLAGVAAAQPSINTPPSLTECTPTALQWSNAQGTVRLFILPAGEVSAAPLANLPDQTGASGSYVWDVNIAAGTNITIAISDDSGVPNYAFPRVVMAGSSTSCLNAAASTSSSGTAAAGGAASSTAASSSSVASSSSRASSSSAASSSSSAASSSATRATSSTNTGSSTSNSAPAQTSSRAATNAAGAFSPATAGLSVVALAGALLPFL